jgi:putative aldouronate transport system substrate-binding protein
MTAGAGALLGACSVARPTPSATTPPASGSGAHKAQARVKLPTFHRPAQMPQPDFPGSSDNVVEPGYVDWPTTTFQSVKQPPGDGSDVSVFLNIPGAPPPPVDQNPTWMAWNTALNVKLNFQFYAFADLAPKFGTLIAGNELPDIVSTLVRQDIPLTPDLFAAKAADLTPFVSGDAITEYPNLAALPTRSWNGMVFDNKIYGIPVPTPYSQFFWWPFIHQELLDTAGLSQPVSTADYKNLMVALTHPQDNQYGVLSQGGYQYAYGMNTGNGWYPSMFGAPNLWAVDSNGKFTHTWETDNYKQALDFTVDLYKAGVFHPDTASLNVVTAAQDFEARQGASVVTGLNPSFWDIRGTAAEGLQPPSNVNLLTPPAAAGFKPQYYNGRPAFSIAFLKKAPEARIRMLLHVLNYIAAPFGSEEYLLVRYGVKSHDWQPDDHGNPITTSAGQTDMAGISTGAVSFLSTVTGTYQVLYSPADRSFAQRIQGFEKRLAPLSVEDASLGLYSSTQASKGVQLIQPFGDGITDIVAGRRPASDLSGLVDAWRKVGGDAVRSEYEAGYAAGH